MQWQTRLSAPSTISRLREGPSSVSDWRKLPAADRGAGEGNGATAHRDVSVRRLRVSAASAASAAGHRLEVEAGREAAVVGEMTGETKEVEGVVEVDSAMMVAAPEEPS